MTENKGKEHSPTGKQVTGRFRNTRLHWLRPQAAGAIESEAIGSPVEQQAPEAPAAPQRRLTILTRLSFIPSSLDAHGRRLRWRQRAPVALVLLAAAAVLLWFILSRGDKPPARSDHAAESALTPPRPLPLSTTVTVTRPAQPEPALGATPPAPSSAVRQADDASSKPAPAATEKKPRALRQPPQAEDPWL